MNVEENVTVEYKQRENQVKNGFEVALTTVRPTPHRRIEERIARASLDSAHIESMTSKNPRPEYE